MTGGITVGDSKCRRDAVDDGTVLRHRDGIAVVVRATKGRRDGTMSIDDEFSRSGGARDGVLLPKGRNDGWSLAVGSDRDDDEDAAGATLGGV